MDENKIYKEAWKLWNEMQFIMLFEEMSELQKEITKHLRGKGNKEHIIEEIADCQIMLDQMKTKFGKQACENVRLVKLARLRKMLKD